MATNLHIHSFWKCHCNYYIMETISRITPIISHKTTYSKNVERNLVLVFYYSYGSAVWWELCKWFWFICQLQVKVRSRTTPWILRTISFRCQIWSTVMSSMRNLCSRPYVLCRRTTSSVMRVSLSALTRSTFTGSCSPPSVATCLICSRGRRAMPVCMRHTNWRTWTMTAFSMYSTSPILAGEPFSQKLFPTVFVAWY